jgi:hypothetical protein
MCIASKVEAAVAIAKEATSNQKVRGKLSGSGGGVMCSGNREVGLFLNFPL